MLKRSLNVHSYPRYEYWEEEDSDPAATGAVVEGSYRDILEHVATTIDPAALASPTFSHDDLAALVRRLAEEGHDRETFTEHLMRNPNYRGTE